MDSLKRSLEVLFINKQEFAPVLSVDDNEIIGLLSQNDILEAYSQYLFKDKEITANLSLKRQRSKMLVRGRRLVNRS